MKMDNQNESEFSLENINNIKEEIETSLYCDEIGKELQKKDCLHPDLRVSFSANDSESSNFVLPDEVSAFINEDKNNLESDFSEIIPPYPSKTTFLTKEMLKENRLFSKASDIDSSKQGSKNYLRAEINSENLFRAASEINSNLNYNLGGFQGNDSNDKENEVPFGYSDGSEPIPYQGPTIGNFHALDANSSLLKFGIKPATKFAEQIKSCDVSESNHESLQPNTESCTNLFQTASNNLKSGKKFAPLFPLSVRQNLESEETSNSSCFTEKEKVNIENQVTSEYISDSALSAKSQVKKPFKPIFKKPKKSIEKNTNSISKPQSISVQKDCLSPLKSKNTEVKCKTDQQFSISQVEVKKEPDIDEVDKCLNAKEKVNFCVAKAKTNKQKVLRNETNSNSTLFNSRVKENKIKEKVTPSISKRNYLESFKNKFSYLYESNLDKTDLINLQKTSKNITKKEIKRDDKKVIKGKVDRKDDKTDKTNETSSKAPSRKDDKTDKANETSSKTPSITVKSVEKLNSTTYELSPKASSITAKSVQKNDSTPLQDKEIKCESEDTNLLSEQNESVLNSQVIHKEESCMSTEISCMNETDDTESFSSDISEANSNTYIQDNSTKVLSPGIENISEKETPKVSFKTKEVKKKRFGIQVGIDKNKRVRFSKKSDSVENVGKLEKIKKKLYDLQTMTNYPVWVCCELCNKWRCLRDTIDPTTVPKVWICSMNEDEKYSSCEAPAEDDDGENILYIFNKFTLGSLVWVTNQGSDWWPAMVDDCPDNHVHYWLEEPYENPAQYHVTFFGSEATRAWVEVKYLRNFDERRRKTITKDQKMRKEHAIAMDQALQANSTDLFTRRKKYCFASRRKGKWFLKNVS